MYVSYGTYVANTLAAMYIHYVMNIKIKIAAHLFSKFGFTSLLLYIRTYVSMQVRTCKQELCCK